jgi:hypothetical protein
MPEFLAPLVSPGLLVLVVMPMMAIAAFAAYLWTSRRSMNTDVNKLIAEIMANVTDADEGSAHSDPHTVIYAGNGSTVLIRSVLLQGATQAEEGRAGASPIDAKDNA